MSTVKRIAEEVAQGLNQVLPDLNCTGASVRVKTMPCTVLHTAEKNERADRSPALEFQKIPPQYGVLVYPGIAIFEKVFAK